MRRALAAAAMLACASPAAAQIEPGPYWDAATVYAVLDKNEWCQGGSIHVDLWSGDYTLLPRPDRRQCQHDPLTRLETERGTLGDSDLSALRALHREAVLAGLEREDCTLIVSNGGREVLLLVGPRWSLITPEEEGCWSAQARELHAFLFETFGAAREGVPADNLDGRRIVEEDR